MAKNNFRPRKFEDFEIVDEDGKAAGSVRVKPSGMLWRPKGSHAWYGISLEEFAKFALENGKKQKK